MDSYDVIVSGAGPVGLTLAIDLGRRGVRTLLLERNATPAPYPKMDRSNARTMEIFRRLGVVDQVRARGYPPEVPMNVFIVTRLADPPIAVLEYPSVAERRTQIAACTDGSLPLEPYQLVSQNKLEPLLKQVAEAQENVTVRYGAEVFDFAQDSDGVVANIRSLDGREYTERGAYLVGCDGGVSTVRKRLGIPLEGRGRIKALTQVSFWSEELFDKIPIGKGRHYNFADAYDSVFVVQGDRKEFTLNSTRPVDADFETAIRDLIGFPVDIRIVDVRSWNHNLLVAERYGDGRVFMAGDAVHLVIPTGGLGMNTGVGDATDLAWKLAGAVAGWGGEGLLESYEAERRPIGLRNRDASGWAAAGVPLWRKLYQPHVRDETPEGEALRRTIAAEANVHHRRMHEMVGVEWGYSYAGSPLIADEPGNDAEWETSRYDPHARPGVRLPHMWLSDGRPLHDLLGLGFSLVDLTGAGETAGLEQAFADIGAPLEVLRLDEPHVRKTYGAAMLLVRPDLHVVWRGDQLPQASDVLARLATGHGAGQAMGASAGAERRSAVR